MQTTDTSQNKKLARYIRWKGFIPLFLILGLTTAYVNLFFDTHLKELLERVGVNLNGAAVNIGSFHTSLLDRTVEIENIQIAHHTLASKNFLEIDKISFNFQFEPLLRKKLIINEMNISGIHLGTKRDTSGLPPYDPESTYLPPNFLDRVVSDIYSNIAAELNENPLKHLGTLSTGLNIPNKVETLQNELESVQHLKQNREELEAMINQWDMRRKDYPSPDNLLALKQKLELTLKNRATSKRNLASQVDELKVLSSDIAAKNEILMTATDKLTQELKAVKEKNEGIERFINNDVALLKTKLDLPRLDLDDLTSLVFGSRILGYLERFSYLVDVSRRKMPTGSKFGPNSIVIQPRDGGASVHFGKNAGNPSFLIMSATLSSDFGKDESLGKVDGKLRWLTTDPYILGRPTTFTLDADFPAREVRKLHAEFEIDHVGELPHEKFKLSMESFPMENWMIAETPDIKLKIDRARAGFSFEGNFDENQLKVGWQLLFRDVEYDTSSRYKLVQEILKNIVTSIYSFDLIGTVEGSFSSPKFESSSEFGKQLATGLKREFRYQLNAIDDSLKANLLDQVNPRKQAFSDRLTESTQKVFEPYFTALHDVQALQALADKSLGRDKIAHQ